MAIPHENRTESRSDDVNSIELAMATIARTNGNEKKHPLVREISGPPYSIFGPGTKMWIIFLVSISALISPFAATTYYPALNVLSDVLHVTPTMVNISITTFMVRKPESFFRSRAVTNMSRLLKP
jgi:hypothetical protein